MAVQSRIIWMVLCLLVLCSVCAQAAENKPPDVVITKRPSSPVIGETIVFDATGSRDPEGGTLTFLWTFVDEGIEKSGPVVTYSYSTEGTKTILLTVTDNLGARTFGSAIISVNPSPPEKPTPPIVTETIPKDNETFLNPTPMTPKPNPIITMVPTTVLTNDASGQSPGGIGGTGSGSNQGSGSAPANASPAGPPYIMYMIVGAVVLVGVVLGGIVFVKRQR